MLIYNMQYYFKEKICKILLVGTHLDTLSRQCGAVVSAPAWQSGDTAFDPGWGLERKN